MIMETPQQNRCGEHCSIIETAAKILSEYPLCDRCLGRVFAKKGIELSNEERGRAIKTLLAMKLYADYTSEIIDAEYIGKIASNTGDPVTRLYRKITGREISVNPCYICLHRVSSDYIDEIARRVAVKLSELNASSFIIGVKLDSEVVKKELDVHVLAGLESSESLKNELKREIGKRVTQLTNIPPDFDKPDVVVIVDVNKDFDYSIQTQVNPILLKAIYFKRGRRISHVPWFTSNGSRKYPESIQDFIRDSIAKLFDARDIKIHAAGREDVDARMLGSGRPLVIEVKEPGFRNVDLDLLNYILDDQFIKVSVIGAATRRDIESIKEGSRKRRKIYRVAVLTEKPVSEGDLEKLSSFFKERSVKQRTPTRILRRKKDRERIKRVYRIEVINISSRVFEALIYCDGGLYVKELVHCDNGRTTPCFSEILGTPAYPLELDVLYIEKTWDK
ncbi:MAG: tRNA pseudouridine(54/55) synthase Pus10 [Desulfurococcus sp.]|uniref:tRNA pseudouridine(54/55) synthase Pus10 n=1 Tax=Desulfurococcus sp. TaxID=51678 RepID=UPI003D0EDC46